MINPEIQIIILLSSISPRFKPIYAHKKTEVLLLNFHSSTNHNIIKNTEKSLPFLYSKQTHSLYHSSMLLIPEFLCYGPFTLGSNYSSGWNCSFSATGGVSIGANNCVDLSIYLSMQASEFGSINVNNDKKKNTHKIHTQTHSNKQNNRAVVERERKRNTRDD